MAMLTLLSHSYTNVVRSELIGHVCSMLCRHIIHYSDAHRPCLFHALQAHHTLSTRTPHTTEFKSLLKHFIAYGLHADNLPSPAKGQAQSQSQLQLRNDTAQETEPPAIIPATTIAGPSSSSPGSSQLLPISAQQASDRAATEPQLELLDGQELPGAQGGCESSKTLAGITSTAQGVDGQRSRAETALAELIASARWVWVWRWS